MLGLLTVVFSVSFLNNVLFDRTERQEAVLWDDRMEEPRDGEAYVFWMFLPSEKMEGKMIGYHTAHMQVEMTPAYAASKPKPVFYYGTQSASEHRIICERAFRFVASMLIFFCLDSCFWFL